MKEQQKQPVLTLQQLFRLTPTKHEYIDVLSPRRRKFMICEKKTNPDYWTVHTPLIYRKIVELEDFALQVAILDECQIYLAGSGGRGWDGFGKKSYNPQLPAPRYIWN